MITLNAKHAATAVQLTEEISIGNSGATRDRLAVANIAVSRRRRTARHSLVGFGDTLAERLYDMRIPHDAATARTDHQRAVTEFVAAAQAVPAERWERKPDETHWSPAQIAEHVRLTYEVVGEQFRGGPGLRVRTSWWMRALLRWKFLRGILEDGVMPKGARAPREVRPGDGPFERESLLAALQRSANATEDRVLEQWKDPRITMTHHVFGKLDPAQGARLLTVHTGHHAEQLRVRLP